MEDGSGDDGHEMSIGHQLSELVGDLANGQAARQEAQDVTLSLREPLDQIGPPAWATATGGRGSP
jgi:hypothetical protein